MCMLSVTLIFNCFNLLLEAVTVFIYCTSSSYVSAYIFQILCCLAASYMGDGERGRSPQIRDPLTKKAQNFPLPVPPMSLFIPTYSKKNGFFLLRGRSPLYKKKRARRFSAENGFKKDREGYCEEMSVFFSATFFQKIYSKFDSHIFIIEKIVKKNLSMLYFSRDHFCLRIFFFGKIFFFKNFSDF